MSENPGPLTYESRKERVIAKIFRERIDLARDNLENRTTDHEQTLFIRGKIAAYREFEEILSEATTEMNKS